MLSHWYKWICTHCKRLNSFVRRDANKIRSLTARYVFLITCWSRALNRLTMVSPLKRTDMYANLFLTRRRLDLFKLDSTFLSIKHPGNLFCKNVCSIFIIIITTNTIIMIIPSSIVYGVHIAHVECMFLYLGGRWNESSWRHDLTTFMSKKPSMVSIFNANFRPSKIWLKFHKITYGWVGGKHIRSSAYCLYNERLLVLSEKMSANVWPNGNPFAFPFIWSDRHPSTRNWTIHWHMVF